MKKETKILCSKHSMAFDIVSKKAFHIIERKIDLFLFPGPSIQEVNDQYTVLTGRPQMPPQWATAYHQCKWNYRHSVTIKNGKF